jgi:hypothetical protein
MLAGAAVAGIGIAGLSGYEFWRQGLEDPSSGTMAPGSYGFVYTASYHQASSWYAGRVGLPVRISDFPLNEGALATWVGVPLLKPASILCLDPASSHRIPDPAGGVESRTGLDLPDEVQVVRHDGRVFIAFSAACIHACCVLGYHEAYPGIEIYHCTCHNARFDPWTVVKRSALSGRGYYGALNIQLPADRPLPYIPLELVGDRLHGILTEKNRVWYRYCGVKKEGDP